MQQPTGAAALDRDAFLGHYNAIWAPHTWPADAVLTVTWERGTSKPSVHVPITDPEAVWDAIVRHCSGCRALVGIAPRSMNMLKARQDRNIASNAAKTAAASARGEAASPKDLLTTDLKFMAGGKDDVYPLPALFADLDVLGGSHAATDLPTRAEAEALLARFPVGPPTILIWTGGGYHAWWGLKALPTRLEETSALDHLREWLRVEGASMGKTIDLGPVSRQTTTRVAGTLIGKGGDLRAITVVDSASFMGLAA